jgi:hypothetical protein
MAGLLDAALACAPARILGSIRAGDVGELTGLLNLAALYVGDDYRIVPEAMLTGNIAVLRCVLAYNVFTLLPGHLTYALQQAWCTPRVARALVRYAQHRTKHRLDKTPLIAAALQHGDWLVLKSIMAANVSSLTPTDICKAAKQPWYTRARGRELLHYAVSRQLKGEDSVRHLAAVYVHASGLDMALRHWPARLHDPAEWCCATHYDCFKATANSSKIIH